MGLDKKYLILILGFFITSTCKRMLEICHWGTGVFIFVREETKKKWVSIRTETSAK